MKLNKEMWIDSEHWVFEVGLRPGTYRGGLLWVRRIVDDGHIPLVML
jgi:hypothetical protein